MASNYYILKELNQVLSQLENHKEYIKEADALHKVFIRLAQESEYDEAPIEEEEIEEEIVVEDPEDELEQFKHAIQRDDIDPLKKYRWWILKNYQNKKGEIKDYIVSVETPKELDTIAEGADDVGRGTAIGTARTAGDYKYGTFVVVYEDGKAVPKQYKRFKLAPLSSHPTKGGPPYGFLPNGYISPIRDVRGRFTKQRRIHPDDLYE